MKYCYLILIVIANQLNAQVGSIFEKISIENGLPSNYIFCITEDENGFIWAGSDKGLLKYDGAKWQIFDTDNGLPGNYVNQVCSDGHGGLWLGISEQKPVWFNTQTKKIYAVELPGNYNDNKYYTVNLMENGELIIENASLQKRFTYNYKSPLVPIVTSYSTININDNELLLAQKNKKFIICSFNNEKYTIKNNDSVQYISVNIPNKTKYLFRRNGELYDVISTITNFIVGYNFVVKISGSTSIIVCNEKLFERNNKINNILQSGATLYFSKLGEGLCTIDTVTGTVTKYNSSNGLSNNDVNHLYKATDGAIYISTLGGGINIIKFPQHLKFELPKLPVSNIQVYNGKYYLQSKNEINILDKNRIEDKIVLTKNIQSFLLNNNKLLVGTFDGFEQYNIAKKTPQIENVWRKTAGVSGVVKHNNNYIISTYGGGIYEIKDCKLLQEYRNIPFKNVEKLIPLLTGVAALSYESGFIKATYDFKSITHYTQQGGLLHNAVYYVHEYKDTLWVASKNGISVIANNIVTKTYSYNEGFIGTKAIYIFTDYKGTHWVLGDVLLKLENGKLKNGGIIATLNNDKFITAYYNQLTNEIAISSQKGLVLLPLKDNESTTIIPEPTIIKVVINDSTITYKPQFTLPYNYTSIKFYFANIGNGLSKNYTIYTKIEGQSNTWMPLTDSLTLNLDELRPGTYKIFVKTIHSSKESTSTLIVTVTIQQPLLLQPLMLFLYTLIAIAVIYWIVQYINRKKYKLKLNALKLQQELEYERQRISRDLHDNMGAYTNALLTNVQQLKNKTAQKEDLEKMQNNAEHILSSLRETIWVLNVSELSITEFSDTFKDYCFKILRNYEHINMDVTEIIDTNEIIQAKTAIHLNKIMQEAIQNIIKHANATIIKYTIQNKEGLYITISDNGNGILNENVTGNGIKNMQWRANEINMKLVIHTNSTGTKISVQKQNGL